MALLREWGELAVIVKLDIKRAFDLLSRIRLAERIQSWASHKPFEAAKPHHVTAEVRDGHSPSVEFLCGDRRQGGAAGGP